MLLFDPRWRVWLYRAKVAQLPDLPEAGAISSLDLAYEQHPIYISHASWLLSLLCLDSDTIDLGSG